MAVKLKKQILKPFASAARSAGVDQASSVYISDEYNRISLIVDATDVGGAPTSWGLDAKVQYSPDTSGTRWIDLPNGAITQLTAEGTEVVFDKPITGARRIRILYTLTFVGGSSPTLTFEVDIGLSQV